ncbi:uncharacterized protein BYT42DRAFT_56813 [Radiomyces spectabilis]|uniref:uncharacterized protein n=1 Tax=Radiomyces spectabilis TaxID=64574 RepID=UPI00221E58A5|nr:uncharacterized protein BYT42DRAFT_56813 [Radiomyces spectabilis]KAI8373061.1 hypothetical protein BYT42DRAFT_56813 [Radiomyces spectabilis]
MSKETRSPQQQNAPNQDIDAQLLFEQYNPALHFDSPPLSEKSSNGESWYLIGEQTAPTDQTAFWNTVKRWTEEPQFVIPPIEKANILESTVNDHGQDLQHPFERVQRELVPKRKSKDSLFVETVEYYEYDSESGYCGQVVYRPSEKDQPLPFYYPKVAAYRFVYIKDTQLSAYHHDTSDERGLLRLEVVPLTGSPIAVTNAKMQYALKTLLHKLFKWCIQARLGYKKQAHHDTLVAKDTYVAMYQYMKEKYAQSLVSNWTEKTDPQKFVFEDIAIASYLICLWKEEEARTHRKPTFVDLGCGNGLLTHLLISQGFSGYGVDIASRKIWKNLCRGHADSLRVETLYPAQASYPTVDWIIGNHADELVPWIPIIAAKSGEHCKFLVIPCCFYGLDGTRRLPLRATAEGGKYRAYTHYIKDIASQCGYQCEQDYLRIPSTKNIALVGRQRSSPVDMATLKQLEETGRSFVPRKTDREKDERRRELKRSKIEKKA